MLESRIAGFDSLGVEINPLCRLITKVKSTVIPEDVLRPAFDKLITRIRSRKEASIPDFPNLNYWFTKASQKSLARIKSELDSIDLDKDTVDFFRVCLSSLIRQSSRADPRIPPPVFSKRMRKLMKRRRFNALREFSEVTERNIQRMSRFERLCTTQASTYVVGADSKNLPLDNEKVGLIITSPPYMSAQKYLRSTRLELFWLGLLKPEHLPRLDAAFVGTEKLRVHDGPRNLTTGLDPLDRQLELVQKKDARVARVAYNYFTDMETVIHEASRVLETNGKLVLVTGDNLVSKIRIPTHEYLAQFACDYGLAPICTLVDEIKSYGLMTKRNKTAGIIPTETIMVFEKSRS
jgi:hypothetical protein